MSWTIKSVGDSWFWVLVHFTHMLRRMDGYMMLAFALGFSKTIDRENEEEQVQQEFFYETGRVRSVHDAAC